MKKENIIPTMLVLGKTEKELIERVLDEERFFNKSDFIRFVILHYLHLIKRNEFKINDISVVINNNKDNFIYYVNLKTINNFFNYEKVDYKFSIKFPKRILLEFDEFKNQYNLSRSKMIKILLELYRENFLGD